MSRRALDWRCSCFRPATLSMARKSRRILSTIVVTLSAACPISLALPGDLNDDSEVSLPHVLTLVGCIEGPSGGSTDPSRFSGDFDYAEWVVAEGRTMVALTGNTEATFLTGCPHGVFPAPISRIIPRS
jgi:hypothetical protein